jgi:glycosyltransferase involved in cell wall biosynthesis
MNKVKKIYIIDGFLVDFNGHPFMEATALRDATENLGIDAQIIGSKEANKEIALENNILPLVPDLSFCPPVWLQFFWKCIECLREKNELNVTENQEISVPIEKQNLSWKQKLKCMVKKTPLRKLLVSYWLDKPYNNILKNLPKDPDSLYLFQTSSFHTINHVLRELDKNKLDLRIVFSSHANITENDIRKIIALCKKLKLTTAPAFFWSSEIHVKKYHDIGLHSAKLLPIPQPGWSKFLNISNGKNKDFTLTFLGHSAYRKGFHLLPELIKKIRKYFPQKKFQFDIQYSKIPKNDKYDKHTPLIESTYSILQKMDVNLISESLDNEAYYNLLNRADIVLMPYQTDSSSQHHVLGATSGILLETMTRAKIPIVPANTWLSLQLEKFNSGKIFSNNEDFFSKTIEAINEFDSLKSIAEKNKEYWIKLHCPEQVIKTILS